jgi:hypothetical protein
MKLMCYDIPILLLIYDRPNTVKQVMSVLRVIQPRHLYVAADGARPDRPNDKANCLAARKVATDISWSCELKTLFRGENLGCRRAVSEAIDWFFDKVEEGIILEDDCVPDPSFFRYAQELLCRFREDERIMVIAAQHFHGDAHRPPHSYFFSRYNHCWGWASWRRSWKLYDKNMSLWPALRNTDWLLGIGNGSRQFQNYWTDIFNLAHAGKIDSWAYRWTFSCWVQNGLSILPSKNLVANIGFGENATHTKGSSNIDLISPLEHLDFPLEHPPCLVRDTEADAWSDRHLFHINRWSTGKRFLRWIPGMLSLVKIYRSR